MNPRLRGRRLLAALVAVAVVGLAGLYGSPATAAPAGPPPRPAPPAAPDPSLQVHALQSADGPLDNPLKGFARFYSPGANQNTGYPHSLTWGYFGLSEVMTNPGNCGSYDWSIVDNMLNETASNGNQAAIRFY